MKDNFDLRSFLVENKLTENSRKNAHRVHFGQTEMSKRPFGKALTEGKVARGNTYVRSIVECIGNSRYPVFNRLVKEMRANGLSVIGEARKASSKFVLTESVGKRNILEDFKKWARKRVNECGDMDSGELGEGRKKAAVEKPTWDEVKRWITKFGEDKAAKVMAKFYPDYVESVGDPQKALQRIVPSDVRATNRHNSKMRGRDEDVRMRRADRSSDRGRRDIDDRNNREKNGFDNPMPSFD